jgi:hypothetical protein
MTDEKLAELHALAAKGTPRPWSWNSYSGIFAPVPKGHPLDQTGDDEEQGFAPITWIEGGLAQHGHGDELHLPETRDNARYIGAACNALQPLVDHIDALDVTMFDWDMRLRAQAAENAELRRRLES